MLYSYIFLPPDGAIVLWQTDTPKQLKYTFSLPPGHTGVCVNLIEGQNRYFIHTFLPLLWVPQITVREYARSA